MAAIGGGGGGAAGEETTNLHHEPDSNKRKLDEIEMAKQKAQEIAARLFNTAESKRSRFDEASDAPSFSQVPPYSAIGGAAGEETTNIHQEPDSNKRKLDEVEMAKQKAQEIAARLFNIAETKRSRFDEASEDSSFSQVSPYSGVAQKPASQLSAHAQAGSTPFSAQQGSQYGFQGSSKRMEIPNAKVGVIIGKGGETIKYLQLQSGARIHITKDTDADPYSQTRDVEITGSSEQITRAEQLIKDVIAETDAGGSGSSAARGSSFGSQGGDQFSMKVPNDKVAWVIGKGGETIKTIQSRSGARIQIIPLHLPPGDTSTERTVYISGSQEQIDSAKNLVNDVISGNRIRNLSAPNAYPQQGYAPPGNWGQPPMQQPGHGYAQPGNFAAAPPPYYSNYPQQTAAWDQSNPPAAPLPPQQNTGYNYYGQQTPTEAGSVQPNASYPYGQQAPAEAGSAQPNANYGYGQLTPTEVGSAQPNAGYAYGQTAPTANNTYDHSYSQQAQSYGQEVPAQVPQHDQQNQYTTPGYGPPAASAQSDGTVPPQSYATQPPSAYPYNQQQTGYGPPPTYAASQQGYDQTGYIQPGYAGQKPPQFPPPVQSSLPTSQPVYGQGGYPSQPAPAQSTYTQGTNPPVYGQQPTHLQPTAYTEPLAYGTEKNGVSKTTHANYGSSPAAQEGVHPQS